MELPSNEYLGARRNEMHSLPGRIPPQSIEMEQSTLGALLVEGSAVDVVADIVSPEMFYKEQHRLIYESILDLNSKSEPVDMLTVMSNLSKRGLLDLAGGRMYIAELTSKVASAANIAYHASIIANCHQKRRMITIGMEMARLGYDETVGPGEIMDMASTELSAIESSAGVSLLDVGGNAERFIGTLEQRMGSYAASRKEGGSPLVGVPSGIPGLDGVTQGFRPGHFIIVGARPAMGKTQFLCQAAIAIAMSGAIAMIFSLEMDEEEIQCRIGGILTGIDTSNLGTGDLSVDDLRRIRQAWSSTKGIYINDRPDMDMGTISRTSRSMARKTRKKVVVMIDHLGLLAAERKEFSREREVASNMRGCKKLSKQLSKISGGCVMGLSQLTRGVANRGNHKPELSDLRESGAAEQDADLVVMLHRESYYGVDVYEDGSSTKLTGEILVKKNRGGMVGDIRCGWEPWARGWVEIGTVGKHKSDQVMDDLPDPRRVQPKEIPYDGGPRRQEERDDFPF